MSLSEEEILEFLGEPQVTPSGGNPQHSANETLAVGTREAAKTTEQLDDEAMLAVAHESRRAQDADTESLAHAVKRAPVSAESSTAGSLTDADVDAMFAGTTNAPPAIPKRDPIARQAHLELEAFLIDRARVRSRCVDGQQILFVITSKPITGGAGAIVHAGVEPAVTVERHPELLPDEAAFEHGTFLHRAWAIPCGDGRLVRLWGRRPSAQRNEQERRYAVRPDGLVRVIDAVTYQRLRRALVQSAPSVGGHR